MDVIFRSVLAAFGTWISGIILALLMMFGFGCTAGNTYPTEWSVDQKLKASTKHFDVAIQGLHDDHKAAATSDEVRAVIDANKANLQDSGRDYLLALQVITDKSVSNAESILNSLLLPVGGIAAVTGIGGVFAGRGGARRKRDDEIQGENKMQVAELRSTLLTMVHNMALSATPPATAAVASPSTTETPAKA